MFCAIELRVLGGEKSASKQVIVAMRRKRHFPPPKPRALSYVTGKSVSYGIASPPTRSLLVALSTNRKKNLSECQTVSVMYDVSHADPYHDPRVFPNPNDLLDLLVLEVQVKRSSMTRSEDSEDCSFSGSFERAR